MGPIAEPTPTMIRNRGAAERKKTGRVEAAGAGRREKTCRGAGEEVERGEEGDGHQQLGEGDGSEESLEVLMEAVAEAISQAEREAAEEHAAVTTDATLTREEPALTGPMITGS